MSKPSKADREKENRKRKRSGEKARKEAEEKSRKVMKKVFYHLSQFISVYLSLSLSKIISFYIYLNLFSEIGQPSGEEGRQGLRPAGLASEPESLGVGACGASCPLLREAIIVEKTKEGGQGDRAPEQAATTGRGGEGRRQRWQRRRKRGWRWRRNRGRSFGRLRRCRGGQPTKHWQMGKFLSSFIFIYFYFSR